MRKRIRRLANALRGVLGDIGKVGGRLAFRRGRWKHFHDIAVEEHDEAEANRKKAEELRKKGAAKKAARHDRKANLHARRSQHAQSKAQEQVALIKSLNQKRKKLAASADDLQKRLKALKEKADAGNPLHKIQEVMLSSAHRCAAGLRRNFYSMGGTWSVDHVLSGEPYGYRSDCSQWFTSVYKGAGARDPNNLHWSGGFTGSLITGGEPCSREYARTHAGCAIIFGTGVGHHVEMSIGDGTEHTIGHGSAPIDMGVFDLLPGPIRFYKYV